MSDNNKFYIATAIPYVNDKPHIGHAMDFLYADILARYHRQLGDDVFFNIGADEHGAKIAEKAEEAGVTPQEFTDKIVPVWEEFADLAGISNDKFIRTTSKEHEEAAQTIWKKLDKHIYKDTYLGWYCVGCEEYKTETYVKDTNGICPNHNRKYDVLKEENYFFKLSHFADRVKKAIETDQLRIVPQHKKNEMLGLLREGLEDISVSRPTENITWGVPVPGDDSQVMYVWFEALMNYITTLDYPGGERLDKFWPAQVQVIGKDILRFHAAIWPAMLLGLGLELPKNLYVHGHVSSNGQKMSKTLGNVIDPVEIIEKYGLDSFRYFVARHFSSVDDSDFTWEKFISAYNNELANELGNAVSRVSAMIIKYLAGDIGETPPAGHDVGRYRERIDSFRFDLALEEVWGQIRGVNQYIEEEKPWVVAKEGDEKHLQEILAYLCSSLLEISDMLVPFLPESAQKIRDVFGGEEIKPLEKPLFPRVENDKSKD